MSTEAVTIYLVGGAIRDGLLGLPVGEKDWLVVGATPQWMLDRGYKPVGKDFPVFLHPTTKEEYALARTERKTGKGYKGFTFHTAPNVSIEEDLQRRDLTINAMAQLPSGFDTSGNDSNDPHKSVLIDPYGGQQDLADRVLRHVSDAFVEDPLRVLRVARFAAKFKTFGFSVASETLEFMRQLVATGEMETLVAERVWQETEKALTSAGPEIYFNILSQCGALQILMPEFTRSEKVFSQMMAFFNIKEEQGHDKKSRLEQFSAMLGSCFMDDNSGLDAFADRCKLPQKITQDAKLIIQNYQDFRWLQEQLASQVKQEQKQFLAEKVLALFSHLDIWRRSERLPNFFRLSQNLDRVLQEQTQPKFIAFILNAASHCQKISVKEIIDSGYQHQEIAEQLKLKRLEVLNKLFY